MLNSPGVQSLMRQLTSNPETMRALFNNENMNNMSQMLSQNPAFMQQMFQAIPGMQGNPQILHQMQNMVSFY